MSRMGHIADVSIMANKSAVGIGNVIKILSTATKVNQTVNHGKFESFIVVSMIEMEETRMNQSHY